MVLGKFCWFASANSTCRGILLAGLLAAPAAAQSVTLDVEGEIEASCELSGLAGSVSGLDFSVADSTTLDFTVDCNAPFAYALESGSQAFRTVAPFTLPPQLEPLPGATRLEYQAGRRIRRVSDAITGGTARGASAVRGALTRGKGSRELDSGEEDTAEPV